MKPPALLSSVLRSSTCRWLIVAGLLVLAWQTTAAAIWLRWFPHWSHANLSLWQRLAASGGVGRYILLVPLLSALLAVLVYRRVGLPSRRTSGASIAGWTLLLIALAIHAMSLYAGVTFTSGLAWVMTLGSLLLLAGGWPLARAYGAPVLLLLFAVPLPMVWIAQATLHLKFAASSAAIWLAHAVGGLTVHRYGSYLVLPGLPGAISGGTSGASGGGSGVMVVADACSGLRSLGALVWCAALFALLCQLRGRWRWSILLLAVPLAIACNILRITATLLLATRVGIAAVTEGGTLHHWLGLAAFIAAMAALLGYERLVMYVGHRLGRDWSDPRWLGWAGGQENRKAGNAGKQEIRKIRGARVPMIAVLFLAAMAVASLNVNAQAQPPAAPVPLDWSPIPMTLRIAGQTYRGSDLPIDERIIEVLHTHNILYRRYLPVSGDSPPARGDTPRLASAVDLLVVFSATDRQSIHPPEVCLRGGGWQLVEKPDVPIPVAGQDGAVAMRQLVGATPDRATCHLYTYRVAGYYTTSYVDQQAAALWAKLAHETSSVALVRISALAQGKGDGHATTAAQLAAAAAAALMPRVDRALK